MIKMTLEGKGIPVPLIFQPVYKMIMLLAVLKYGTRRPHVAPLSTVHVYMWALRTEENFKILMDLSIGARNSIVPWSFEPGLKQMINLAVVNGFCERVIRPYSFEIKLTVVGEDILQEIVSLDVFEKDLIKLRTIGIVTKAKLQNANKNWSIR
jgi:hypothetical protein